MGVELIGNFDLGGPEFFTTKAEAPEGDHDLLQALMDAANKEIDPTEEEGGGFNTNFTHSDILEPCTLIHFGWWEISIENQNVWGREILVSSIFVGLCSLSMCTYSDVVGVI